MLCKINYLQIAMMHLKVTIWIKVPVVTIQLYICNRLEMNLPRTNNSPQVGIEPGSLRFKHSH